ncbi:MAG: glycosyltransferase family 4 protein, partial [Candidatus Binataceae bacterium]
MNPLIIAAAPAAAFAISWASVPLARRAALWLGITAEPVRGSTAARIPVIGGASIIAGALIAMAAVNALAPWLAFGMITMFLLGLVDDAIAIRPRNKLIAESVVVIFALVAMPAVPLTPWPALDVALVVLWLLATTNAFNLIDGLDGLAAGVGMVAALAIAATGLFTGHLPIALMALAIAGGLGGFLVHNFHPASIFMGDGGALPMGFALGGLAVLAGQLPANSRLTEYAYPVLVMLVPILDTAIVTVTRLATGRAISRGGLDHSHHRLLSLGLPDRTAAMACWSVAALGAGCAIATAVLPHSLVLLGLPFIALVATVLALFMMD